MKDVSVKVALVNHVGGGNLGDDATITAVMQSIRMRWPGAEIHAITMNPRDSEIRHGIPCHKIRRQTWSIKPVPAGLGPATSKVIWVGHPRCKRAAQFFRRLAKRIFRLPRLLFGEALFLNASRKQMRYFNLLVICGGGQLTERDGPWAFPYTLLKWTFLAKVARVKTVFLNVGAGPLKHPLSKLFCRYALTAAEYVSFRDNESLSLARTIGFSGTSSVFPDNAYMLQCLPPSPKTMKATERGTVGFAPVPYGDPRLHPDERNCSVYEAFVAKCALLSSGLVGRGYSVALFGTDIGVDPSVMSDVAKGVWERIAVGLPQYDDIESVEGLLASMSAMDYVITCRFHGVIFAHLLNKPVLAIAHHPKVKDLMNSIGLSEYCVDIETFDPVQAGEMFASLVGDAENVRERMAATLAKRQFQLAVQFDGLFPPHVTQATIVNGVDGRRTSTFGMRSDPS